MYDFKKVKINPNMTLYDFKKVKVNPNLGGQG